jgi:hypothetical protein
VEIPVACDLEASAARAQLDEWADLLARSVERATRVAPGRAELRLRADAEVGTVVALAQREARCCGFFRFRLVIGADDVTLVVEVPDTAVGVLDGFAPAGPTH